MTIKHLLFIFGFSLPAIYCQIDPCTDHLLLDNIKRSAAVTLDGTAISDDRLREGWYRVASLSGDKMPTEPPGFMRCGTMNPIWLNGTLPTTEGTELELPVCLESVISTCHLTWNINIRRCPGGFLVYHLVRSQQSSSAYCFGTDQECPNGEYSETGFSPGCSANVPQDSFSPVVIADLAFGITYRPSLGPSLEPVFNCSFSDVTGQSYAYDVHWFINGETVIVHRRLDFSDIGQALLRPAHWVNTYHLNMVVKCGVRARFNSSSVPGPLFESPFFEAGVKPDKTVHRVKEGEEISIFFTSSVPVGCIGSSDTIRPYCTRTLKIAQPKYQSAPAETCNSNIQAESLAFDTQECGLTIPSNNWNEKVYLNVTGYIDNIYNEVDRVGHIRLDSSLNSSTDLSGVWHKIIVPDIQVYVSDEDSSLTSRVCGAWNDPVFLTADGTRFSYHGAGEFVFYRHKRYPYWVHILTSACSWRPSITCICGVAVRSHDSLFVMRSCDVVQTEISASGRHYPSLTYASCDNKHMTIKKLSNKKYQVTLPIGTEIQFFWNSQSNPTIILKPSLLDIEQSEGLCGYISKTKDVSDDLKPRGSDTPTSSSSEFAKSWRIEHGSNDELFSPLPNFPPEDPFLKEYCLCASEADQSDDLADFVRVHCNLTAPMVQCKNTRTTLAHSLYDVCHRERQTREVKDSDDIVDDKSVTYGPNYDPNYLPPEPVWRNGWDETTARQACVDALQEMPALEVCKTYAAIDEEDYVESCINDVKTAGSSDVIINTVNMIQATCQMEIKRNESLWKTQSGGESILELIENLLCSPNCTKNGYCNRTQCVCNPGYIGSDCSTHLSDAPTAITVPDEGSCNTRLRACAKTNIFGEFNSETIFCQLKHFTIQPTGKVYSGRVYTKTAGYSYENKVSCTFPENRRKKRDTTTILEGYDISLSYDQVNYGDSVSILIYDGQCYTCNTSTFACDKLASCPDISEKDDEDNKNVASSTVLGAVIALSILLVVIATVLIVYKCKIDKDRKNRQQNSHMNFLYDSDIAFGAPPISTDIPPYRRGNSNLSFDWSSRSSSVHNLFNVEHSDKNIKN